MLNRLTLRESLDLQIKLIVYITDVKAGRAFSPNKMTRSNKMIFTHKAFARLVNNNSIRL